MVAVVTLDEERRNSLMDCCENLSEMIHWLDSIDCRPGLKGFKVDFNGNQSRGTQGTHRLH